MSIQNPDHSIPGLFVFHQGHLQSDGGGGVQICSREYFQTLQAAGFDLRPVPIQYDHRILTRLRRRLRFNPYRDLIDTQQALATLEAALTESIEYIFLNQRSLGPLARPIRELLPQRCRIVLLSHGLESVDYLHLLRTSGSSPYAEASRLQMFVLAQQLIEESRQSGYLDHVFCLSPFEIGIERWLGARSVSHLPRTISTRRLDWKPLYGRFGFVGRLDHPPNAEGLFQFLEALQPIAPRDVRVRIVGAPDHVGNTVADRFPITEYLGPLSDAELVQEAATWNCFVHPLFCYSRGCSTKLAVALGWEIPIVTTTMGYRGYTWHEGDLSVADTPKALTALALQLLEPEEAQRVRREVSRVKRSSPTIADIASLVRSALFSSDATMSEGTVPRLSERSR